MSSNSSSGDSNPIEAFATPYLNLLEKEVLPVIVGITLIIILIIGIVLNSILLYAIKKRRLETTGQTLLFSLIILDCVAYIVILFPSVIVSFAKEWILSDFVCTVNGAFVTTCFLMTFYVQLMIFVERWIKISNPELHEKTLGRTRFSVVIIVLFWIIFIIVGLLPFRGWGAIQYISYQHLCNIKHKNNKIGMNLLFTFGIFIPSVLSLIFLMLIEKKRREILRMVSELQFQSDDINPTCIKHKSEKDTFNSWDNNMNKEDMSLGSSTNRKGCESVLSISQIRPSSNGMTPAPEIEVLSSEIIQNGNMSDSLSQRSSQRFNNELLDASYYINSKQGKHSTALENVYHQSKEQTDIHLTITYLIMWGVSLVLWGPYVVLCYLDAYETMPVWGGIYSIVVLITHLIYSIKPIVYLSHNKNFKEAAYQTLPESVRTKTTKVRNALRRKISKVDDFVFIQGKHSGSIAMLEETEVKQIDTMKLKTFASVESTKSKRTSETLF